MVNVEVNQADINRITSKITEIIQGAKFSDPIRDSMEVIKFQCQENFDSQGFTLGDYWAELADSTVKQRVALGYGPRPILIRTSYLRDSFEIEASEEDGSISNTAEYAKYHQYGTSRIPKRTILKLTSKSKNAIRLIFQQYIKKLIK